MDKVQAALELLKQPSTYKGLIVLAGLAGWHFGIEQYQDVLFFLAAAYSVIAIFWQKS